jgi:large subunit ribosomal protein L15
VKSKREYRKKRKRIGRGPGSGSGKTAGRGHKGQHSRSGSGKSPGFEGGQLAYVRRLPKRGFSNARFKKEIETVNVRCLVHLGITEITPEVLAQKGLIDPKVKKIKILGSGKIDTALTVNAHYFTESAKAKIEAAGGKAVLIDGKK